VEVVRPAQSWERPPAAGRPAGHWAFAEDRDGSAPPAVVAHLPGGRVVGPYGAVMTADDTLLYDLSPYYGTTRPGQHPVHLRWPLPPARDVDGTLAVLTTRGVDNYYHFLLDVLPRVALLREAGVVPDRYLVNRSTAFQRELLPRFGIEEGATVESTASPHVRAEHLVVPSLPDAHLQSPPWVAPWLRQQLLPADLAPPARRIYVTRGRARYTRHVENEDEVLAALAPYGIELVDPGALPVAEQIRCFAEAELVVGAHGAGLTNVAFCPPGAAVVELFPVDYTNTCYWRLVSTLPEVQYRYLVADGRPVRRRRTLGVASDITVGTDALVQLVEELLGRSAAG
jgi:capsular polysaccharide biosynthesis protein